MESFRGGEAEPVILSIEEMIESADSIGQRGCQIEVSALGWLQEPDYSGVPISGYHEKVPPDPQTLVGTLSGIGLAQMSRYGDTGPLPAISINDVSVLRPDGSLVGEINGKVVVRGDRISGPLRLEFHPEPATP